MDIVSHLAQIPFLQQLTESDLQTLAKITSRQRYVAGEDIIKQGDFTDHFFIIDEGHVHFRKTDMEGFEHALGSKGPGDYFGLPMFTSQEPSDFTAEAIGQAWLYVMSCEDFDKLTDEDPELLKRMPKVEEERKRLTRGFNWLTPGEIVAFTTHRHKITLLKATAIPLVGSLILLGIVYALGQFKFLDMFGLPWLYPALLGLVAIVGIAWVVTSGADWADDDFIVTNKRVIHSERALFLTEVRNEIPINKIQSLTILKTTPIQNFLRISTLEIRSAGKEESRIVFDQVANADKIKQIIERQRGLLRARQQAEERERFRKRVGSDLRHYVFKNPIEEAAPVAPPARRRGVWARFKDVRHRMFGYEFREGSVVTWRKHWVALLRQVWMPLLGVLALVLALVLYLRVPLLSIIPGQGFFAVWGVLLLVALGVLAWQWEDWRNDIYQVTDTSIIDIERLPFGFDSKETTALLVNVQDAKVLRPSFWHGLLNYGNVEVQVAGGGQPLTFYNVTHPQQVANEIFKRLEGFRLRQRERETSIQSRNIVDALVAYHRLLMQERHGDDNGKGETVTSTTIEQTIAPPPTEGTLQPPAEDKGVSSIIPVQRDREEELSEFPPSTAYRDEY